MNNEYDTIYQDKLKRASNRLANLIETDVKKDNTDKYKGHIDINPETADVAFNAISKRIKKSPKIEYYCPSCGALIDLKKMNLNDEGINHCINCGQLIDWSNTIA